MVSFLQGLRNGVRGVQCTLLSAGGFILGGVARLPGGNVDFVQNTTKALRRLAGCNPQNDPDPDQFGPGFSGGQCGGVNYRVDYQNNTVDGPFGSPNVTFGIGPVRGPWEDTSEAPVSGSAGIDFDQQRVITISGGAARKPTILNVSRTDGQPDNCGNPPPVFPPPAPINIDIDVTYNTEEGDEITVTIPFIFAPIITDITGNFRFPFTFDFGGIEFSGDFSLAPEFTVNINPPPAPRGTDSPITDLPAPDDEIPVAPSTFRERVVGVVVQARLVGEQQLTTIATTNIPQILAPRAGSIKFGYAIAGRSFWSDDIDIKDLNTFIPCPFSQGADTVAATPAPGVVLNYVPVFGAPLATVADLGSTPIP